MQHRLFKILIFVFIFTIGMIAFQKNIGGQAIPSLTVPLSLKTQENKFYQDLDFSVNVLASPSGTKVGAATTVLDFPASLNLVSITPKDFFSYPASTEMLALGISCQQDSDCRTIAQGVICDSPTKFCKNPTYPANSPTKLRFDLSAACDIDGTSCYPPIQDNILATVKFRPNKIGSSTISFNNETTVAVIDSNNQAISTNEAILGNPLVINVIPQCTTIDFDNNHNINVGDIQQVSSRWNLTSTSPNYNLKYDLDGNNIINIKDIQLVSSRWQETCP